MKKSKVDDSIILHSMYTYTICRKCWKYRRQRRLFHWITVSFKLLVHIDFECLLCECVLRMSPLRLIPHDVHFASIFVSFCESTMKYFPSSNLGTLSLRFFAAGSCATTTLSVDSLDIGSWCVDSPIIAFSISSDSTFWMIFLNQHEMILS